MHASIVQCCGGVEKGKPLAKGGSHFFDLLRAKRQLYGFQLDLRYLDSTYAIFPKSTDHINSHSNYHVPKIMHFGPAGP